MKIAMFGQKRTFSREGGVETVTEELSTRLAALGHQVTCYDRKTGSEGPFMHRGVEIIPVCTWNAKGLAAVTSGFFAALKASFSNAEVVHIHAEGLAFWCFLPKLLGKRVVVTVHGLDWQRAKWSHGLGSAFIRAGERMTVKYAHEIIVLSRNAQRYFRNTYGRKTVYIPNGIEKAHYREPQVLQEQFSLEKDGYLLFLGRLVPEKGVHYLLEAFRGVKTEKRLVIAGASSDTEGFVEELKQMARQDSRVLFTGFAEESLREALYSNAYLYVLPSDLEGMPMTLLEAMSHGCCCVISDIPECTEVAQEHGAVVPRGDVDGLRDCLQRLCDDPALRDTYRRGTAEFICQKYSWEETMRKTLEVYKGGKKNADPSGT